MGHLLQARTKGLKVVTLQERPSLLADFERLSDESWPRFLRLWKQPGGLPGRRVFLETFADYQLALLDEDDAVAAVGNTLPFTWDGATQSLPSSIIELKRNAWENRSAPNALAAIAALVAVERRGQGLSSALLKAMASLAVQKGLSACLAPVRPTHKAAEPMTPMAEYMRRTDPQGLPADPWLRTHVRLGAEVLGLMPRALEITASVAEWSDWTGLSFPTGGEYAVPEALAPVLIDRRRGEGRYVEANVWVRHRLRG